MHPILPLVSTSARREGRLGRRRGFWVPPFWQTAEPIAAARPPCTPSCPLFRPLRGTKAAWVEGGAIWGTRRPLASSSATCMSLPLGNSAAVAHATSSSRDPRGSRIEIRFTSAIPRIWGTTAPLAVSSATCARMFGLRPKGRVASLPPRGACGVCLFDDLQAGLAALCRLRRGASRAALAALARLRRTGRCGCSCLAISFPGSGRSGASGTPSLTSCRREVRLPLAPWLRRAAVRRVVPCAPPVRPGAGGIAAVRIGSVSCTARGRS